MAGAGDRLGTIVDAAMAGKAGFYHDDPVNR